MVTPKQNSVWGPFATVINVATVLAWLVIAFWVVLVPISVLGDGSSFAFDGDRDGEICARSGDLPTDVDDFVTSETLGDTKTNVDVVPTDLLVCEPTEGLDDKPVKYGLKLLTEGSIGVVCLAALFGARRIMKRTDRRGAFGHDEAAAVRRLGWWLLGGFIVATAVKTAAESLLLGTMLEDQTWGWVDLDFPVLLMLASVGLVVAGNLLDDWIKRRPRDVSEGAEPPADPEQAS